MQARYSAIHQVLHWVTAFSMFAVLPLGWIAVPYEDTPHFEPWLHTHEGFGVLVLIITSVRIVWRAVDKPPRLPRTYGAGNRWMARATHYALLAMMIAMPVSGFLWTIGHGHDVIPFGWFRLPRLFFNNRLLGDVFESIHLWGRWFVYGLITLHLGGVAFHVIWKRDLLLERMLPRPREPVDTATSEHALRRPDAVICNDRVHLGRPKSAPGCSADTSELLTISNPSPRVDILIESLREEDVGELLTVQRAAFLRDAQLYCNPFLPSLMQTVEEIRAGLSDPNRIYLVAKCGTRLVGSVRAVRKGRIGHISRLMSAPDLEGRGIGRALLSAVEMAMRRNVDEFLLITGKKSTANIEMYERHGYVRVGDSTDSAGIYVVTMSKRIMAVAAY